MFDRVFKNWKTSILAVALIIFFGVMMYQEKVGTIEGIAGLSAGFVFFFTRDGWKKAA